MERSYWTVVARARSRLALPRVPSRQQPPLPIPLHAALSLAPAQRRLSSAYESSSAASLTSERHRRREDSRGH
jgi:hypothetical protein